MNSLAQRDAQEIARPLKVLVPLIIGELEQGDTAGLEHYRRAGEMLLEAREQVEDGTWRGWVARNFHLSRRSAQRYMQLAAKSRDGRQRPFRTLSEVSEPKRVHHQPEWYAPVQHIVAHRVDVDALLLERQNKAKEAQIARALGLQLIDIGYKVLATKLHPDKGGSTEAMARLNHVRDLLKHAL
jgi:hypothetical protein